MGTLGSNRGGPGSLKRGFGGFEEGGGSQKTDFCEWKIPQNGELGSKRGEEA